MDALGELKKGKLRYDRTFSDDANTTIQCVYFSNVPYVISDWLSGPNSSDPISGSIRRMAVLADWVNGEDVFEVEKPHKFVVRSKETDSDGDYRYLNFYKGFGIEIPDYTATSSFFANWFMTRMDAELWTTNGYEVVEIDGDGNEV
jgi:hypothetical protein